jgi:hypothetical protein
LTEQETFNQGNAQALAKQLAELNIGSVLGTEANPAYGLDDPVLALRVQRRGAEPIEYRIGRRDQENDYVLKVSSRGEYFRLPGYSADALIELATREQLVAANADAAGEEGAGQEQATPVEGVDTPGQSATQEEPS